MIKEILTFVALAGLSSCTTAEEIQSEEQRKSETRSAYSSPKSSNGSVCEYEPTNARRALLIGVSGYPTVTPLAGPKNDIALLHSTLIESGLQASDICVLADSLEEAAYPFSADTTAMPTRANIDLAMRELALASSVGDDVMIYFSGHGSYMPDSLKEGHPIEPDGTDEFFLPLDVGRWSDETRTVQNALVDDEIEAYISAIQNSGAFVWMVADFCHSGFSSRNDLRRRDVSDTERTSSLGIPRLDASIQLGTRSSAETDTTSLDRSKLDMGRFVGFYASKQNEPTYEFPIDASINREPPVYHGVLTWNLLEAIRQGGASNYGSIATRLRASYWNWGQSRVTPIFDGDLSRTPMIGRVGDDLRTVSRNKAGEYSINAGGVDGLRAGSRVALLDLTRDSFPELATAVLTSVGLESSTIKIEGEPDLSQLRANVLSGVDCGSTDPNNTACRLLSKAPGQVSKASNSEFEFEEDWHRYTGAKVIERQTSFDVRVGLSLDPQHSENPRLKTILSAIQGIQDDEDEGIEITIVDNATALNADILLAAKDNRLIFLTEPFAYDCLPPANEEVCDDPIEPLMLEMNDASTMNVVQVLRRLGKAQNILSLADMLSASPSRYQIQIKLAVADPINGQDSKCAEPNDPEVRRKQIEAIEASTRTSDMTSVPLVVQNCELVGLTIENDGSRPLDVTPLYINDHGEIFWLRDYPDHQRGALRLAPNEGWTLSYTELLHPDNDGYSVATGMISLVVLATEADTYRDFGPDFRWLEQEQIAEVVGLRSSSNELSVLGDLLESGAFGTNRTRMAGSQPGAIGVIQYQTTR